MWENSLSILCDTSLRLLAAAFCGGVIGIERQIKRHAAGFRTHIVICVGAALTMMISQYLLYIARFGNPAFAASVSADVSRIGAQVINGISFLGAGTIIMTGRRHVKGLTTSAGLWAAACMGLAVGTGFYLGALTVCFYIFLSANLFAKIESALQRGSKSMNLFFVLTDIGEIGELVSAIKEMELTVEQVDIQKDRNGRVQDNEVIISLKLPPKVQHTDIIVELLKLEYIFAIEEI